jgi:hypothetical protein
MKEERWCSAGPPGAAAVEAILSRMEALVATTLSPSLSPNPSPRKTDQLTILHNLRDENRHLNRSQSIHHPRNPLLLPPLPIPAIKRHNPRVPTTPIPPSIGSSSITGASSALQASRSIIDMIRDSISFSRIIILPRLPRVITEGNIISKTILPTPVESRSSASALAIPV